MQLYMPMLVLVPAMVLTMTWLLDLSLESGVPDELHDVEVSKKLLLVLQDPLLFLPHDDAPSHL
jgi:hypothetical protein